MSKTQIAIIIIMSLFLILSVIDLFVENRQSQEIKELKEQGIKCQDEELREYIIQDLKMRADFVEALGEIIN